MGARRLGLSRGRRDLVRRHLPAATRSRTACCRSSSTPASTRRLVEARAADPIAHDHGRPARADRHASSAGRARSSHRSLRQGLPRPTASTSSATCSRACPTIERHEARTRSLAGAVQIYDTTLRDGTQREGISLSAADKLRIARRLDALGVAFIEGGWPGSNPKDAEFFERARDDRPGSTRVIAAFGSTRRARASRPRTTPQVAALLAARDAGVHDLRQDVDRCTSARSCATTLDENLRDDRGQVAYLRRAAGGASSTTPSTSSTATRDDAELRRSRRCARRRSGGADVLVLCDTNGGTLPWDRRASVVRTAVGGARAHPSASTPTTTATAPSPTRSPPCATARAQVQGTINGYGERCGNANLCAVIAEPRAQAGRARASPRARCRELSRRGPHFVAEDGQPRAGRAPPYVGRSAFAHKGGVHVAAMRRKPRAYQHVDPALVGNEMRVVVSELSGRGNVLARPRSTAGRARGGAARPRCSSEIKEREARGFSFEAAEASVALLLRRRAPGYVPPFELDRLHGDRRAAAGAAARSPRRRSRCAWAARSCTPPPRATAR